jgi:AraC-like DNA-binding protein
MSDYFEHYVRSKDLHLKYAKGEPSAKGQEFHNYHEIVLFFGGKARFISKSIQKELSLHSLILVPRASFHQFAVRGSDYTRLILGFYETEETGALARQVMQNVRVIDEPAPALLSALHRLAEAVASDFSGEEKELFIRASLIHILLYLKKESPAIAESKNGLSPTVAGALSYIDGHYTRPITVEQVAQALHVSVSQLFHKFKEELQISVYQYVSKKRIANARLLIEAGETAANAAATSGFSDYSVFFRTYVKTYGEAPSRLRKQGSAPKE